MPVFGFFGGNLMRLANRSSRLAARGSRLAARGSRLEARGSGSQARKIASPEFYLILVKSAVGISVPSIFVSKIGRASCRERV